MLLTELLRSLHSVRDNLSSCDIPVLINGLSFDLVGVDMDDYDCPVVNLRIQRSQVEDHQSETQVS